MNSEEVIGKVKVLINAYKTGQLGNTSMPEDTHPQLTKKEDKLLYYSLPMALNYQRNSYKLWEAAKQTWEDEQTRSVFNVNNNLQALDLRNSLLKYKLALQPNKHIDTWGRISKTISSNYGSISNLLEKADEDYLKLRKIIQGYQKSGFPYLSGPKIFNYWSYILTEYCDINLRNRSYIEIAPDTHVIQASIKLGVIQESQINKLSRENISKIWRDLLEGSRIDPIDVHSPLWFWSRGGFKVITHD